MDVGKKNSLLSYSNKTFVFMSKYWMQLCPQTNQYLIFQRKEGPTLSCHVPKILKCLTKFTLDFYIFFETNRSVASKPPKKCLNITANVEPSIKFGDFRT